MAVRVTGLITEVASASPPSPLRITGFIVEVATLVNARLVADNLSNWADEVATSVTIINPDPNVSDDLNNWSDSVALLMSYLGTATSFEDSFTLSDDFRVILGLHIAALSGGSGWTWDDPSWTWNDESWTWDSWGAGGESLNYWQDHVALTLFEATVPITISVSDNMGTLKDGLEYFKDDVELSLFLAIGDLGNFWADEVQVSLVVTFNDLGPEVYDSMAQNWADEVQISLNIVVNPGTGTGFEISDAMQMLDSIQLLLTLGVPVSDEFPGLSDNFSSQFPNDTAVASDLNFWQDHVEVGQLGETIISVSVDDNLNYWLDSVSTLLIIRTSIVEYLRRYLVDTKDN